MFTGFKILVNVYVFTTVVFLFYRIIIILYICDAHSRSLLFIWIKFVVVHF